MSASRSSVAHNYFRPSLRILFTAFLETKPQLWKLMSAISGCCIGSSGSPLHPPLHIPLIKRDDLCSLSNSLVTEIRLENEKCFLTCLYRSPSKNQQEFENFCSNFEVLMDQINNELPNCSVITGDFNARCSKWWNEDITNSIGREIDTLTLAGGYKQIINQPTHIVNNSLSCIDLIFCNNMNLISNFGVDFSIFEKCHHNKAVNLLIGINHFQVYLLMEKLTF